MKILPFFIFSAVLLSACSPSEEVNRGTVMEPEEGLNDSIEVSPIVTIDDFENYEEEAQTQVYFEGEKYRTVGTADSLGWSCTLEYQDLEGNVIELPEAVENSDATQCLYNTAGWHEFSPDETYVVYTRWDANDIGLYSYNFESEKIEKLMSFYQDSDGINQFTWSPDGTQLAFYVINQMSVNYPTRSKIFVLDLDENGVLLGKKVFEVYVSYNCGDNRCSEPNDYFQWLDDKTLQYQTWLDPERWDWGPGDVKTLTIN